MVRRARTDASDRFPATSTSLLQGGNDLGIVQ
jgi:hypothetical protein